MSSSKIFHIALVVNPLAGLGGPSGLKGSDSLDTAVRAKELGVKSAIPGRLSLILDGLAEHSEHIRFSTASGPMGADYLDVSGHFQFDCCYEAPVDTSGDDTRRAVNALKQLEPDLLLFAGGDGTARDVCSVLNSDQVCLGIPSGVKMHSGVFAVTPGAVVSVVKSMLANKLIAAVHSEVRDIDERSFKEGRVITKHYGELLVPDDQLLVQSVKCSGLPEDEVALNEIAAFIEETVEDDTLYLLGSGSSLSHIKRGLGIDTPTLLGVDAWANGEEVGRDLNEPSIFSLVEQYSQVRILLSVIGGQGIVLGRGNQQISARVLEQVGPDCIQFIGTQQRLLALEGRPLRVDSGSDAIDKAISGYQKILCAYDDFVLYEIRYSA